MVIKCLTYTSTIKNIGEGFNSLLKKKNQRKLSWQLKHSFSVLNVVHRRELNLELPFRSKFTRLMYPTARPFLPIRSTKKIVNLIIKMKFTALKKSLSKMYSSLIKTIFSDLMTKKWSKY